MSIGTLRCIAVDVTDFDVSYRFWSAVTGWEVLGPEQGLHGWLGVLATRNPPEHEMILIHTDHAPIKTPVPSHHHTNCLHLNITPTNGVAAAIDWAVMQDPFGNEFCLVRDLIKKQSAASLAAAEGGVNDDRALREAAGQTGPTAVMARVLARLE